MMIALFGPVIVLSHNIRNIVHLYFLKTVILEKQEQSHV